MVISPWAAWQIDNAVSFFGARVTGLLYETDKQGKARHQLKDILDEAEAILSGELKRTSNYDRAARFGQMMLKG